jgi:O-antigen/teichoic acid export membrane protein
MFQAVQAALLPRLSRLAARGELDEFRAGLKRLLLVVLGVGVVGSVGALILGPFVIDIVYGADLSGRTLAMLALGSACYMVALSLAQAVIALRGHAFVAVGWIIGVVAFFLGTWLFSDDLFKRVEFGLLLSSVASMATFAIVLRRRLAQGVVPDEASLMDAINDMPIDK